MINEELPVGFAMSLAMDYRAIENYAQLSDVRKAELVDKSKRVSSKQEMERLVQEIRENKYR